MAQKQAVKQGSDRAAGFLFMSPTGAAISDQPEVASAQNAANVISATDTPHCTRETMQAQQVQQEREESILEEVAALEAATKAHC